jgi:3-hydroxyisobutyrate dehydrogenase-like beta-hydroxyacid dehydrogenase
MTTASNDNSALKVGFIGLGAMGAPMARHLHARGMLAVVGNRTQGKADALAAELGVRAARSTDNFAGCDVVALCVSFDADVLENVEGLANLLHPGAVVIDHSTVSVDAPCGRPQRCSARTSSDSSMRRCRAVSARATAAGHR